MISLAVCKEVPCQCRQRQKHSDKFQGKNMGPKLTLKQKLMYCMLVRFAGVNGAKNKFLHAVKRVVLNGTEQKEKTSKQESTVARIIFLSQEERKDLLCPPQSGN